jgi:DNA-binding winged helix-turn-helix (wHTH) protein/tetratricopeptide (TPR) repeat protein
VEDRVVRYRFGEFELDTEAQRMARAGAALQLWPKVFDVLRYLIEQRGRLVTKQELLDKLWPDSHVSEGSVPWTISHARRALGQRGGEKHPIETVHGRGYRFSAEVEVVRDSASRPPSAMPPLAASATPLAELARRRPFVGRSQVMEALEARLRDATDAGRGAVCLLVGPAGIGKTRCMDELEARAHAAGFTVCAGRSLEDAWAPAFWPWVQVLRGVQRERPALAAGAEALLARLEAAGRDVGGTDEAQGTPSSNFWWFDGVSRLLSEAARERPVLIFLDDVQWADAATLELLAFMAPELRRQPMVVVGSLRDGRGASETPGMRRLSRHVQRIEVGPLSDADVSRYLDLVTQSAGLDAALSAAMYRATAGNPLFLEHSVRLLLARHGEAAFASLSADLVQPTTIARDTLTASLQRVEPVARELLAVASVLGERVDLSTLQVLAGCAPEDLLGLLDAPLGEGFVVAEDPGTLRFCHGLLRSVLYEALPADRRAVLHRRTAEILEQSSAARLGEVAHHHYCSLSLGDAWRVVVAAERAARAAGRVHAFADAARFCDWAVKAQASQPAVAPRVRAELLLFHAQMQASAGDDAAARRTLRDAIEIARGHGLYELLVQAARILRPTYMMGSLEDPLVQSILEEALRHAPEGANEMRINALSQLSWVPPYGLDLAQSKELSARALSLATELGEEALLLRALHARLYALSGPDDGEALLAVVDRMLATSRVPAAWVVADAYGARCGVQLLRGELAAARATRAEIGRQAQAGQWPAVIWYHDRLALQDSLLSGDFVAATAALQELRAHGERWAVPHAGELSNLLQGLLLLETLGARVMGEGMDLSPLRTELQRTPLGVLPSMARLLLELGDRATAQSVLERLTADEFASLPREISYVAALANLGVLAVRLGDTARAQQIYAALLPYAHCNTPNLLFLYEGSAAHFLGVLAAFLGLDDQVQAHFEAAVRMNEALGVRPQLARSCYELGAWLRRGPRAGHAQGQQWLSRARALAVSMGMQPLLAKLDADAG